jgi:hypothetical protein
MADIQWDGEGASAWTQAAAMESFAVDAGDPPVELTYIQLLYNLAADTMLVMMQEDGLAATPWQPLTPAQVRQAYEHVRRGLGLYGVGAETSVQVLEFAQWHLRSPNWHPSYLLGNFHQFVHAERAGGRDAETIHFDFEKIARWWRLNGWGELEEQATGLLDLVLEWCVQEADVAAYNDLIAAAASYR